MFDTDSRSLLHKVLLSGSLPWFQLVNGWKRAVSFGTLALHILLYGKRPKVCQGRDRNNELYWYAYYPRSGECRFLTSEAEIKQWSASLQDI